jgi:hypothetical protein
VIVGLARIQVAELNQRGFKRRFVDFDTKNTAARFPTRTGPPHSISGLHAVHPPYGRVARFLVLFLLSLQMEVAHQVDRVAP